MAALVGLKWSSDWMCIPHFDSPSVFAAILDDCHGGRFKFCPGGNGVVASSECRPRGLDPQFKLDCALPFPIATTIARASSVGTLKSHANRKQESKKPERPIRGPRRHVMSHPATTETAGLYAQVLGHNWDCLEEPVRRLHIASCPVKARGVFRVQRGGWLARRLAGLVGLPRDGEQIPLQLVVTSDSGREQWHRSFAGRPFISWQWKTSDGSLAEQMGLFVQQFRLSAANGALLYEHHGSTFRLGFLRIPLPGWLSPKVTARETASGEQVAVVVTTHLPLVGLLVTYEGNITIEGAEAC